MAQAEKKTDDKPVDNAPAGRDDLNEYPGRTLGVVAVVFAFFAQVPALVMGIIAWVWSHKAGHNNVPAKVAVAVSGALIVIGLLVLVGWIALLASWGGEWGGDWGYGHRIRDV